VTGLLRAFYARLARNDYKLLTPCYLMVRDFKELRVWQTAMVLVDEIHGVTAKFPKGQTYALSLQLRRAIISVASNIAEGCGKRTVKDFVSFLYNAMGSVKEVECQLIIAKRLGYLGEEKFEELNGEVDKLAGMLMRFIRHVSEDGKT